MRTNLRVYVFLFLDCDNNICSKFTIVIEKQTIAEFMNFMEAFECLFAVYYNFNMAYPKQTACILEFIQRYILKIHPDQGTKNKKKNSSKLKIISLTNKLRDM